jgi:hypothetical protein
MARTRAILGLLAGILLILSASAHTFLGWKQLSAQLTQASIAPDLLLGLTIGWYLGGMAMLVFGLIALTIFIGRLRGETVSAAPTAIIGVAWVAFGAWALAVSGFEPFFYLFVITGAMLTLASLG